VRLLIADDDRDAAETLAEMLRLFVAPPIEIVLAFDGQEALAATTGSKPLPDAVIMDIEMPRMNGVNAAIGIRSALGSGAPTLIAVTGYVGIAKLAGASTAFDHVLTKPVRVDELLRLLG
jgi:CheY-like chemotaxis protein